jgi:hypothetical protein
LFGQRAQSFCRRAHQNAVQRSRHRGIELSLLFDGAIERGQGPNGLLPVVVRYDARISSMRR